MSYEGHYGSIDGVIPREGLKVFYPAFPPIGGNEEGKGGCRNALPDCIYTNHCRRCITRHHSLGLSVKIK